MPENFEMLCGCIVKNETNPMMSGIAYCPKHKAAPEMYEALNAIMETVDLTEHMDTLDKVVYALHLANGGGDV